MYPMVEIQKSIVQAYAASRLIPTRACTFNGMTHPIIGFIEFFLATKHTKGFTSRSTISPGPVVYVTKQAKGRKKEANIIYSIIPEFPEESSDSIFSHP